MRSPLYHPDYWGSTHLWNVGDLQRDYTALKLRMLSSSYSPLWEPEISLSVYVLNFNQGTKFLAYMNQLGHIVVVYILKSGFNSVISVCSVLNLLQVRCCWSDVYPCHCSSVCHTLHLLRSKSILCLVSFISATQLTFLWGEFQECEFFRRLHKLRISFSLRRSWERIYSSLLFLYVPFKALNI
jgi:hypothetical protein